MRKILFVLVLSISCISAFSQSLEKYAEYNYDGNRIYGYTDENGKVVIKAQYEYVQNFYRGTAAVGKYGAFYLINETGAIVSDKYNAMRDNGIGMYLAEKGNGKSKKAFLINFAAQKIFDATGCDVNPAVDGYVIIKKDGKFGVIDINGNQIIPFIYSSIGNFRNGYAQVENNNKYGLVDTTGREICPCIYSSISEFINGYAVVGKNYKYGVIDTKGRVVYPCRYSSAVQARDECQNLFSTYAKKLVETELNSWQKKGEFEKTIDWKKRVTLQTRDAKIKELTQLAEKKYIEKYQNKDIVIYLMNYDADNETFMMETSKYGNLLVPVPVDDAPDFKKQWFDIKKDMRCFIENDTISLAEILFTTPDGKQFKYSNQASLNYEMAQIDYNFEPIDLELQPASGALAAKGTQSITTTKKTMGLSDVDTDLPVNDTKSDKIFAVVIANEKYQKEAQVPFAMNDGRVFADYCRKVLGVSEKNVHYVANATLNNMKYEINWLKQVIEAYNGDARVIFYYAGHGIPDEAQKTAYLLPVDGYGTDVSTGYKLDDLYAALGNLPSQSVTVFLDACFSGANRNGEMLASARGIAIKAKSSTPVGNMVVFSAAQGDETAYPNNEQQHGMFTYYLLKKLKETKGDVTYKELGDYVSDNVRKQSIVLNGKSQTPTVVPSSSVGEAWQGWKLK